MAARLSAAYRAFYPVNWAAQVSAHVSLTSPVHICYSPVQCTSCSSWQPTTSTASCPTQYAIACDAAWTTAATAKPSAKCRRRHRAEQRVTGASSLQARGARPASLFCHRANKRSPKLMDAAAAAAAADQQHLVRSSNCPEAGHEARSLYCVWLSGAAATQTSCRPNFKTKPTLLHMWAFTAAGTCR